MPRAALLLPTVVSLVTAQTPPSNTTAPAPPNGYKSWVVVTQLLHQGTATTTKFSIGQNIEVASSQGVVCITNQKLLAPTPGVNTTSHLSNYSKGVIYSHNMDDKGNDECTSGSLPQGPIPETALSYFAPTTEQLAKMVLVSESVPCDKQTCKQWHYLGPNDPQGNHQELFWFTRTDNQIPMQLTNQSFYANGSMVETTAAFDGNTDTGGVISDSCVTLESCGPLHCIADPKSSETDLTAALTWACSSGGVNCTAVNKGGDLYFPNEVHAHANYVFDAYYHAHAGGGASSCNFNGAGKMVHCMSSCTTCNATETATGDDLTKALAWACSGDGIDECHYPADLPNTTRAQLDWAMTKFYIAYQCSTPATACAVPGVSGVVQTYPCGAAPVPTPKPTPAPPVVPTPAPPAPPASWNFVCNGGLCQRSQYGAKWDQCKATCH